MLLQGQPPFGDSPYVRIIAGSNKGARIFAPKGHDTRPTADRAREAAFNLIGPVDGATVLDLFAGSGAMGLEALSRGAASVVFVEDDREACRTIDRNLDKLRLNGARVVQLDALRALATEAAAGWRSGRGAASSARRSASCTSSWQKPSGSTGRG